MKKIINPYINKKEYNCFGCSPNNPYGLKMEFYEDDDYIISEWQPDNLFQGYNNILHGGIQTTLIDEIASWVVQIKLKTSGLTSRIENKFIKPVYTNKGKITLKAYLKETKRRFAFIWVGLYDSEKKLCSEAIVTYFTYPKSIAKDKLNYPGYEKFFN
ncbi:MAG: PaaI family thioesterase [Bacteroidales bacterium]|nr:PaaI family thioesterase [Bacteroidales bacterium]